MAVAIACLSYVSATAMRKTLAQAGGEPDRKQANVKHMVNLMQGTNSIDSVEIRRLKGSLLMQALKISRIDQRMGFQQSMVRPA